MATVDGFSQMTVNGRSSGSTSSRHVSDVPRISRRQTLPTILFPKELDRLQEASDRVPDVIHGLERLAKNFELVKKDIDNRQTALMEAITDQFAAVNKQLSRSYDSKKFHLQSLLRCEEDRNGPDVQNSAMAGSLYTGHNGSLSDGQKHNGCSGNGHDLSQLCSFNMSMTDNDMHEIPDFISSFKSLFPGPPRAEIDRVVDLSGKGYHRPSSGFSSSAWTNYAADDNRAGLSDSFTTYDNLMQKPNGVNNSFQSYSSGYNQENLASPAYDSGPMSPFTASTTKEFSFDARSLGRGIPQGPPPPCPVGDFFNSPPRALQGVPEFSEDRVQELLRNPHAMDLLNCVANHVQRTSSFGPGQIRAAPQNPYALANSGPLGLRRTNSNKTRNRSRRFSLPDASRINSWPPSSGSGQQSYGGTSRTGSFSTYSGDGPSDSYSDIMNDDAFLQTSCDNRSTNGMRELVIACRFGEIGCVPGQMNAPHGFCLGQNQEVIVADTNNHRIQFFDKKGMFITWWGKPGKRDGQLWFPRKVAWMPECSRVVVCDRGHDRSRIQIFTRNGLYERTITMDYVAIVAGMTVYNNQIVIVDSVNPTCICLDLYGKLVFWFSCQKNMKEPSDIVVMNNMFYICDFKGHCVCAYNGRGEFVTQIGSHPKVNFPNGIDVTDQGHVLIGDSHGNRFHVVAYTKDGRFLAESECPHMKVSRCCGLVLTPEGHIVTIAKNNNFVLILEHLQLDFDSFPESQETMSEMSHEAIEETQF